MRRTTRTLTAVLAAVLSALGASLSAQDVKKPDPPKNLEIKPAPAAPQGPAPGAGAKAEAKPAVPLGPVIAPVKAEAKPAFSSPPRTLAPKPAPVNHPEAIKVVNRYIDALGGLKALEGVEDRVMKFEVVKHAATGETTAAMNLFMKKGYKIREEWDIKGISIKDKPLAFVQVYNGSEGWVQMLGTVSPLEGKTLTLFVWDKYLDDPFCHWEEDGYSLDHVGAGTVENEPVDIIEMTDFGGASKKRYFFSKATGLLVKQEWREQGQNGMVKKENFYKRYVKLPFSDRSGRTIQFPRLQEIYEEGDLDTSRDYKEVAINSGLKDGIFERPEGEEFKGAIGGPGAAGSSPLPQAPAPGGAPGGKAEASKIPPAHPPVGAPHPPVGVKPAGGGAGAKDPSKTPPAPPPAVKQ